MHVGQNASSRFWHTSGFLALLADTHFSSPTDAGLQRYRHGAFHFSSQVCLRDGSGPDGRAYLGLKRDARDIKLQPLPSPGASNADRLSELKTMRDRGLITEQEYEAKHRQILDRM